MEGWDGTREGEPSELTRPPLAELREERGQADLGRGGRGRALRRPGQPEPARDRRPRRFRRWRACGRRSSPPTPSDSAPAPTPTSSSASSSRTPGASRDPRRPGPPGAARRLRPPHPRPALPRAASACSVTRSSTGWSQDFVRASRRALEIGFRFVDVKHCHGYLGPRAPLGARPPRALTADPSRTGRAFSARWWPASAPKRPASESACACPLSTPSPTGSAATGWARPEIEADGYGCAFGLLRGRADGRGPGGRAGVPAPAGEPRRALGLRHRGQPLLQSARAAAGAVPAQRRLRAARGPAAGRGAPDPGHRPAQGGVPRPGDRGVGVQLPAGVAAPRGPARASAPAGPTSWASAGSCSPIPSCPPTSSSGTPLQRKKVCRTFSDCTSGPRNGLVSGCFPLDPFYTAASGRRATPPGQGDAAGMSEAQGGDVRRHQTLAVATGFLALFSIVGFALYGLPVLLRLLREGPGLDAPAGHLRQRAQQADRGPALRVPGRDADRPRGARAA